MKIDAKVFERFLDKVTTKGKIADGRLNFGAKGVSFIEPDGGKHYLAKGLLYKTAFKTYTEIGEIGINNFLRLGRFVSGLSGESDMKKKDIFFCMSEKNAEFEYVTADVDSLDEKPEFPKFDKWDVSCTVDSSIFAKANDNASKVGKEIDITIMTEEKKLIITTGEDDKLKVKQDVPEIQKAGIKTNFSYPLKDIIPSLDGKINISFANAGPMKIISKDEFMEIVYFIAPKIDDDEDEENEKEEKKEEKKEEVVEKEEEPAIVSEPEKESENIPEAEPETEEKPKTDGSDIEIPEPLQFEE